MNQLDRDDTRDAADIAASDQNRAIGQERRGVTHPVHWDACGCCKFLCRGIIKIGALPTYNQHQTAREQGGRMLVPRHSHILGCRCKKTSRRVVDLRGLQEHRALISACNQHSSIREEG